MKRLLLVFSLFLTIPVFAGEITSKITDSIQLNVQGAAIQTEKIGSSYSASGTNVNVTTLGGLTGGTSSAAATMSSGSYAINTNGQAFTFSEALTVGDSTTSTQSVAAGVIGTPTLYGKNTTQAAGDKGTLAGTLSPTGISNITAGGAGTSATAQRTIELSVFK
jgi:hypothetical protein